MEAHDFFKVAYNLPSVAITTYYRLAIYKGKMFTWLAVIKIENLHLGQQQLAWSSWVL